MKVIACTALLAFALVSTGCSQLISLQPFVADSEAILDARLAGVWIEGDDTYLVRQDGAGYLIMAYGKSQSDSYKLKARILRVGDARILDLTPAENDAFRLAAHMPVRYWVEGNTVRIAFLDSKWLRALASEQLTVQEVDGRAAITSPAEAVSNFLLTWGADDRADESTSVLTRQ